MADGQENEQNASFPKLLALISIAAILLLGWLGFWQVERYHWKQGVKAHINQGLAGKALALEALLPKILAANDEGFALDYTKVKLKGTPRPKGRLFLQRSAMGVLGAKVLTPVELVGGQVVLLDRGFVSGDRLKQGAYKRLKPGQPINVDGLLRRFDRRGLFRVDHKADHDQFVWRDQAVMSQFVGTKLGLSSPIIPMIVVRLPEIENRSAQKLASWPWALQALVNLPDRHWGYALTWFGLALTVFGGLCGLVWKHKAKRRKKRA